MGADCARELGRGMAKRTLRVILVKPSHYDDDGYVIQWWLSTIPSNSLASVYGLLAACAEENALGPDVAIEIEAYDECNKIIDVKAMARRDQGRWRRIRRAGRGSVEPVSPRARSGAQFRGAGCAGGDRRIPCRGCVSMLPGVPPDLKEARALGVTLCSRAKVKRRSGRPHRDIASGGGEARLQLPP